jgi:aryl-alcohol dehydrogenase-like predicted oxidoreductase
MIILNPLEPWPGQLVLPAAVKHNVKLITRVVDYGGLFHDDVKSGHKFGAHDHRTFRPAGWVEAGNAKMNQMRAIAENHSLSLLQLACAWNLGQPPVKSVVPTLIEETGGTKSIESKLDQLASLPDVSLSEEDREEIGRIGDNRGCMALKGANRSHTTAAEADRWGISADLEDVGKRWGIDPDCDLVFTHAGQP